MPAARTPAVVIVRDGWGRNPHPEHDAFNAVKLARTPHCDQLLAQYPWTLIHTSGEDVGLPEGTMGNSEVGHQNIGAGRVVDQESVRISKAIRTGSFFDSAVLKQNIEQAKARGATVHLLGLASDAGVHALMDHLYACLELCRRLGHQQVAVHLFTDGRDTGPFTGKAFVGQVMAKCRQLGVGQVVSVCGRYYAMDRDNRWERVRRAYDLLTGRDASLPVFSDAQSAIQDYYDHPSNSSQQGDEFITPRYTVASWQESRIKQGDSVIFYNYRGDRPREIIRAFVMPEFLGQVKASPDSGVKGFERGEKLELSFTTLTAYEEALSQWVTVAYPKQAKMVNIGAEYLSKLGLRQFRCAETEKFPHVTFFFNDYREAPFPGEARQMAQSPQVATYDLQPQMSAPEVRDLVLGRLQAADCEDFILVNFANGDMVGHTGKLDAAIKAVETVDACVGAIVEQVLGRGGTAIVTADHGNAEQMWDPINNSPHTAHTTYDVECIIVDERLASAGGGATGNALTPSPRLRAGGALPDLFPTVLELMGLAKPAEMTGRSLLQP